MHGQLHTSWPVMQIAALRAESASQAQAPATAPRLAAAFAPVGQPLISHSAFVHFITFTSSEVGCRQSRAWVQSVVPLDSSGWLQAVQLHGMAGSTQAVQVC